MSDFIYSKRTIEHGTLTNNILAIYHEEKPSIKEFHGEWGSLAISDNLYNGFQPYETAEHICVIVGGPVLCFRDNKFLTEDSSVTATQAIYNRWLDGNIKWDEDLSGPFVVLIINKSSAEVLCITDLMSFVPVYILSNLEGLMLSTHVDILANVGGQQNNIDLVSNVDFILHGRVTFPYTIYTAIYQAGPASEHFFIKNSLESQSKPYWIPEEKTEYKSINKAAEDLRQSLRKYVNSITKEVSSIAQFISGGEDSRTLSALLQGHSRDAFIFLDKMNREGRVAKKAAEAYGANFKLATRTKMHYLEILPSCSDLVGSGSQYHHAHTYGFHKSCKLDKYGAVFGGLLSDALIKGSHIKKARGSGRLPFVPDAIDSGYSVGKPLNNSVFKPEILSELSKRRLDHLQYIKTFRNDSAEEWFVLWPSSMNSHISNLNANRRLFRSYEPFMAKEIVKISAVIPQSWKLNRRLFHKVAQPLLKPTKWLFHSNGSLPYFSWHINSAVKLGMRTYRKAGKRAGFIKGNQGSWGEWEVVIGSKEWEQSIEKYISGKKVIAPAIQENKMNLFNDYDFGWMQRVNLMQTLYCNIKAKTTQ